MCLYPRLMFNPKYKANKKNKGNVPHPKDVVQLYVPLGCGGCKECMKKKSNEWKIRMTKEQENKKPKGWFVTLTYSNENYTIFLLESDEIAFYIILDLTKRIEE